MMWWEGISAHSMVNLPICEDIINAEQYMQLSE